VRHFRVNSQSGPWGKNPLPIEPARRALGFAPTDILEAQVFQNAACNWRCWYCFVPFSLLAADESRSAWFTAEKLVSMYAKLPDRPRIIDLTGGQPDLVPEWIPWTMQALRSQGLADEVYLWSDDNLSNDFLWRYLSESELEEVATWPNYGRVGCFKGFDSVSFEFNTSADKALFARQFELFRRLLSLGIDLYAYVTLTTPDPIGIEDRMARFVDSLQDVHPNLPLRTVPLQIQIFTPVRRRLNAEKDAALELQHRAVDAFRREIEERFSSEMRERSITDVPMRRRSSELI
jgi:uncharacterized Fe-S cluster-containing radical SAM superfamily protein